MVETWQWQHQMPKMLSSDDTYLLRGCDIRKEGNILYMETSYGKGNENRGFRPVVCGSPIEQYTSSFIISK